MYRTKSEEVQFHLDRSLESTLKLIRSVIDNPSLDPSEQLAYVKMVSEHHRRMATEIESYVVAGLQRGIREKFVSPQ
jgi:hypothetical protein